MDVAFQNFLALLAFGCVSGLAWLAWFHPAIFRTLSGWIVVSVGGIYFVYFIWLLGYTSGASDQWRVALRAQDEASAFNVIPRAEPGLPFSVVVWIPVAIYAGIGILFALTTVSPHRKQPASGDKPSALASH